MKRIKLFGVLIALCAATLILGGILGCSQQEDTTSKQQSENRQYMTHVNQTMDDLQGKLAKFTDAVSRGDVVGMKTESDNAFRSIEDLSKLNVPDEMKDIQSEYLDGANKLKDALGNYIQLYSDIESATEAQPFDWSTYDQRLSDIKQAYDEGVGKLQSGNNKATEKY